MKKTVIILVCLALLLPISCISGSTLQVDEITSNNVFLRLTTNKQAYELGERVVVNARVENRASEPVDYYYGAGGKIELFLQKVGDPSFQYSAYLLEDGEIGSTLFEWVSGGTLNPGESIVHETFWDQKLYVGPHGELIRVPLGEYVIIASFSLRGQADDPLKATLTIEIR